MLLWRHGGGLFGGCPFWGWLKGINHRKATHGGGPRQFLGWPKPPRLDLCFEHIVRLVTSFLCVELVYKTLGAKLIGNLSVSKTKGSKGHNSPFQTYYLANSQPVSHKPASSSRFRVQCVNLVVRHPSLLQVVPYEDLIHLIPAELLSDELLDELRGMAQDCRVKHSTNGSGNMLGAPGGVGG